MNSSAWADPKIKTGAASREWSNTEGKMIRAEYLGVRDGSVLVRLGDGRVVPIVLAKLSEADKAFIRDNPLVYREAWKAWPADVEKPVTVDVKESPSENGEFIYQTKNFRFSVNGNLGTPLMKDLAQVFELTHALHLKSPFGLLAKPQGERFEARLFGTTASYHNKGGPLMTAGVYLPQTKIFMAPLSLMGVKVDGSVWRRIPRSQTDTSTIVHELTHMLTHDMLVTLPIWVNEGYAEYIANIPIEKDAFRISAEAIRQGVVDSFVLDYEKWLSRRGGRIEKLGPADRSKFLKESMPQLAPVSAVLGITDQKWSATQSSTLSVPGQRFSYNEKGALYRTAHLIIYYFLQLDGEKGISKLQRYVSLKQEKFDEMLAYRAAFDEYERKMEDFLKLPGVEKLEDGRIRYPRNLTLPDAPKPPAGAAGAFESSGMEILFDGETPEVLGSKIEEALIKDLGLQLRFRLAISPQ